MSYRPLFQIKVQHDYYLSKQCADFDIKPTSECLQLLKNYRLHFKKLNSGFKVFAKVNDSLVIAIPLTIGTRFSFLLSLKNSDFYNFTDFDSSYNNQAVKSPIFSNIGNIGNDNILQVNELESSQTENFDFGDGIEVPGGRLLFRLKNRPIIDLQIPVPEQFKIEGDGEIHSYDSEANNIQIDSGKKNVGRFILSYKVKTRLPWGSFGRIDIYVNEEDPFSNSASGNPESNYIIDFKSKSSFWKYWMITETTRTISYNEPKVFLEGEVIDFREPKHFEIPEVNTELEIPILKKDLQESEGKPDTSAIMRFQDEVKAIEDKIDLPGQHRYYFFSNKKIPWREKYQSHPNIKVNGGEKELSITLLPPPLGTDQVQVIRI